MRRNIVFGNAKWIAALTFGLVLGLAPTIALAAEATDEAVKTAPTDATVVDPAAVPAKPTLAVRGLAILDLNGAIHRLAESDANKPLAFVFLSPECPIANQYLPELSRLFDAYGSRIDFYGVISDWAMSRSTAVKFGEDFKPKFPVLFDGTGGLMAELKPTHTPEALVLTAAGELLYRGRIDDQFAEIRKRKTIATAHEFEDAINAAIEGRQPAIATTAPVGCPMSTPPADAPVTYSRQVSAILNSHCVQCHRPGEVAPFALLTYEDAAKRAAYISDVVSTHRMPPWQARPTHVPLRGARVLTQHEIDLLTAWAKAGAPEGNPTETPPSPQFSEGWQLGTPDLVLKMTEPYKVPASGPDVFRFFVLPIDIPEDMVVTAVEFRAGNARVAHHSIMYLDASGVARKRDAADPGPGYEGPLTGGFRPAGTLGFWAPGYTPHFLPEGVGLRLAKGCDLAMQMHYHPSGKEELDQSQIGIYFAKKPVKNYLSLFALFNFDVNIKPGDPRYHMHTEFTTPIDLHLLDVTPHMHMIGTEMKVTATAPDGKPIDLAWVDWNFNWQDQYHYVEPLVVPKGSKIELDGWYDNSSGNPYNPNTPPKLVTFGEGTTDEMCICAFGLIDHGTEDDWQALRRATGEHMQKQLENPRVMLNLMQLMARSGEDGEDGVLGLRIRRDKRDRKRNKGDKDAPEAQVPATEPSPAPPAEPSSAPKTETSAAPAAEPAAPAATP
ncbi:MAG: alkyl hydroperoxide reductase [Pirellulales bacterium]|nr:alkyl hydroperoxide reductase [Pirellulales bacterium]